MRKDFLVFGSPRISEDEIAEVTACLRSGWIGTGPRVAEFERNFAAYKGGGRPVAVNSCTAALHLSILAAGIGPGDEVITTPLTFCATVNAVIHAGATPVLADVDPETMNISPDRVREKITDRTKALLPVHFAGRCCDMNALARLAESGELMIIEDCAHAIETEYHGQKAGTFGDFGCFSFYVTKNIVTGEGGLVLTKNPEHAARLKVLALHGMSSDAWKRFGDEGYKHYLVTEAGFKYNMMDIQAALGLRQLEKVETYWIRRQEIWARYMDALADLPLTLPAPVEENTRHGYHLFTILVDEQKTGISRDSFLDRMTKRKIGVGVHYLSLPEHPFYQQKFGWSADDFPVARDIGRQTVSLPLSAKLTDDDVEDVIGAVRAILE
jgi:dTDP-4-amino-4,6-dideoxygalactose transaminase